MDMNGFEPVFIQPETEWSDPNSTQLRPFTVCVDAPECSKLRIQVTDHHSSSWETIRSVDQLDNLRDITGIGGPWSEFLAYVVASINSDHTKLVFDGKLEDGGDYWYDEDLDALVSITSDEDLSNLIKEYDRIDSSPPPPQTI